jgi:hypothetical protein
MVTGAENSLDPATDLRKRRWLLESMSARKRVPLESADHFEYSPLSKSSSVEMTDPYSQVQDN